MNKNVLIVATMTLFLIVCISCDKKDAETPDAIGRWQYPVPIIPFFLPDTLNLYLDLKDKETYSLDLIQNPDKKLFSSKGSWSEENDSVKLTGSECFILDTTANPDTLKPLDANHCSSPIMLAYPDTRDTWDINTQSMAIALSALLPPATLQALISNMQIIRLGRVK